MTLMGYALITGGGASGRYTISLDIGEAERTNLVTRFGIAAAAAQENLDAGTALLNAALLDQEAAAEAYREATTNYIALVRGEAEVETPEDFQEILKTYEKTRSDYLNSVSVVLPLRIRRDQLELSLITIQKALANWQNLTLTETREAWCVDLTENASGYVATLEVPGDSSLVLIAPGGRYPALSTDGYLWSRAIQAPWQVQFNFAILPGWQKWKPTCRTGTITALDKDNNKADVTLDAATSSAQRLNVNQASTLKSVPVVYMTCNARAFQVGDNVVIQFANQDWTQPRVIGFVAGPQSCTTGRVRYMRPTGTFFEEYFYGGDTVPGNTTPQQLSALQVFCGWKLNFGTGTPVHTLDVPAFTMPRPAKNFAYDAQYTRIFDLQYTVLMTITQILPNVYYVVLDEDGNFDYYMAKSFYRGTLSGMPDPVGGRPGPFFGESAYGRVTEFGNPLTQSMASLGHGFGIPSVASVMPSFIINLAMPIPGWVGRAHYGQRAGGTSYGQTYDAAFVDTEFTG